MPLPQLWAVLFFFMMFILGMGSQFGGIEAINTAVIDFWPHLRNHKWRVSVYFLSGVAASATMGARRATGQLF